MVSQKTNPQKGTNSGNSTVSSRDLLASQVDVWAMGVIMYGLVSGGVLSVGQSLHFASLLGRVFVVLVAFEPRRAFNHRFFWDAKLTVAMSFAVAKLRPISFQR